MRDPASTAGYMAAPTVLRMLRITLHAGFLALLLVGVAATASSEPGPAVVYPVLLFSLCLGGLYLAGTISEKRAAKRQVVPPSSSHGTRYARFWLAGVTGLWIVLMVLSADFSWLAFALFFLHLHLLSTRHAVVAIVLLTGVVIAAQWSREGELQAPMILGPTFGAVFAVVMTIVYQSLYLEGVNQRQALEELRRTRSELARTQHQAGVLTERERLAREIHDTLAQGLSSIVLISRAAEASLEAGATDTTRERIRTVQQAASDNLADARRFVRGLSAAEGDPEFLVGSLRRTCASVEQQAAAQGTSLRCRFEIDGTPVRMPAPYEVALLRAAQSALSNALQHSGAGTAVVTLTFVGSEVTLDIYDNGRGFNVDGALESAMKRTDGTGFGLRALRERISALGGVLDIESEAGEGTVVGIRLPLLPFDDGTADD
ncbi:sensor histidine kinase [Arthrobacter parietis]|uniref:Oxygen sensor histidine kinase NreB n=2 Tax=Arthrobacter TaxID=1663 RepID=A0ABT6CSV6_9MICC|nr:sensor histidine kinase [Arthrobacter vasquezii]MDF9277142.1 sensor histidine kinase [Arthrobacter vasquezii]